MDSTIENFSKMREHLTLLQAQVKEYEAEWREGGGKVLRDSSGRFASKGTSGGSTTNEDNEDTSGVESPLEMLEDTPAKDVNFDNSTPTGNFAQKTINTVSKFSRQELRQLNRQSREFARNVQSSLSEMKIDIPTPPQFDFSKNAKEAVSMAMATLEASQKEAAELAKQGKDAAVEAIRKVISAMVGAASALGAIASKTVADAYNIIKNKTPNINLDELMGKLPKFINKDQVVGEAGSIMAGLGITSSTISSGMGVLGNSLKSVTDLKVPNIRNFLNLSAMSEGIKKIGNTLDPRNITPPNLGKIASQAGRAANSLKNTALENSARIKSAAIAKAQQGAAKARAAYSDAVAKGHAAFQSAKELIEKYLEIVKNAAGSTAEQAKQALQNLKQRIPTARKNVEDYKKAQVAVPAIPRPSGDAQVAAIVADEVDFAVEEAVVAIEESLENGSLQKISQSALNSIQQTSERIAEESSELSTGLSVAQTAIVSGGLASQILNLKQRIMNSSGLEPKEQKAKIKEVDVLLDKIAA